MVGDTEGRLEAVVSQTSELVSPRLLEVMKPTIEKLKAKNKDLQGRLFTIVGQGEKEALIFDSPVQTVLSGKDDGEKVNEFLVVTGDGAMLIQIDSVGIVEEWGDILESSTKKVTDAIQFNKGKLGVKAKDSSPIEYEAGYSDETHGYKILVLPSYDNFVKIDLKKQLLSARLIKNPDANRVEEIYLQNLQRAEKETGISTKGLLAAKRLGDALTNEK